MAVMIHIKVFWVVMMCGIAIGCRCFGRPCWLHLHTFYLLFFLHQLRISYTTHQICLIYCYMRERILLIWPF